jgi:hypothetical protein
MDILSSVSTTLDTSLHQFEAISTAIVVVQPPFRFPNLWQVSLMQQFLLGLFLAALASRALALNIVFGGRVGNLTASKFLDIPNSNVRQDCAASCDPAVSSVQGCGDTNDACLCSNGTISAVRTCQQCLFTSTISRNIPMVDARAGSAVGMTAYAAACHTSLNVTLPKELLALTLPSNWDGPASLPLNTGTTVVAVIVGGIFGIGALVILSNM